MKHTLIIAGNGLKENDLLLQYILRAYRKKFANPNSIYFLSKTDSNLPFKLEHLSKEYEQITIYAHKDAFTLINKILSTLSGDTLELKNDMLIPSKITNFQNSSYIINLNNSIINVLHVEENQALPEILHVDTFSSSMHLVDFDVDTANVLLESLRQIYSVNTSITPLVENWLKISLTSSTQESLDGFIQKARELFSDKILTCNNPIEHIVRCLEKHEKVISLAESCTGGLVSSLLTQISGVSNVYKGGLVSYSNEIKSSWLGVNPDTLEQYGAVSEQCVKQMLKGVLRASQCHIALAISGIAGPDGGSEEKPVGTVFVGVANKERYIIRKMHLKGDRQYIQIQSVFCIFKLLFELEPDLFFEK